MRIPPCVLRPCSQSAARGIKQRCRARVGRGGPEPALDLVLPGENAVGAPLGGPFPLREPLALRKQNGGSNRKGDALWPRREEILVDSIARIRAMSRSVRGRGGGAGVGGEDERGG